jgi:hypothetical protein
MTNNLFRHICTASYHSNFILYSELESVSSSSWFSTSIPAEAGDDGGDEGGDVKVSSGREVVL